MVTVETKIPVAGQVAWLTGERIGLAVPRAPTEPSRWVVPLMREAYGPPGPGQRDAGSGAAVRARVIECCPR